MENHTLEKAIPPVGGLLHFEEVDTYRIIERNFQWDPGLVLHAAYRSACEPANRVS